ncbi:MAG: CD1375 family protein [Peptoniphilus sp.]|uniref:CD1375 family protein n=1 Tax=Peptoniphilus sp. TaxID=1971214 RepID=UPI002A74DCB4|nr:CD1375 family protein [Peptoniphilus sp.]MDY2986307.1 CD1375 family protein [Peptoniphilus sp.]
MFKLGKDSAVVKCWVTLVMAGTYTLEQVPTIFGIKSAVEEVLKETGLTQG